MTLIKKKHLQFDLRKIPVTVSLPIFRQSSWFEAQLSCEARGMTLLSNFYDATMKLVLDQYSEISSGDIVFIGLQRNDQVMCAPSYSYLSLFHICLRLFYTMF